MNIWNFLFRKKKNQEININTNGQNRNNMHSNSDERKNDGKAIKDVADDWLQWQTFLSLGVMNEDAAGRLMAVTDNWPSELDPAAFKSVNWQELIFRIREHIDGPYPIPMLQSMDNPPRPNYQIVDGQIGRGSNPAIDMFLITVWPTRELSNDRPEVLVMRLIEKYVKWPLATFVFLVPFFTDMSKSIEDEKKTMLVVEEMLIHVYKGVENILFAVYHDLPEGGRINDEMVKNKILDLLEI